MEISLVSEAAPGAPRNEDFGGAVADFVVVLDGVTVPHGLQTGCVHGPAWYVRRLGGHLLAGHLGDPGQPLPDLLAAAISRTREEHTGCDLAHPYSPQATVCLLREGTADVEYLVLSDSSLVLERDGRVDVVTDLRHRRVGEGPPPGATVEPRPERLRRVLTKRRWANHPDGYWVAAAEPRAAYQAVTGVVPLAGLTRAALLTDGASCAVDYGLLDWPAVLDVLAERGPYRLIDRVRRAERGDPDGRRWPRFKRHDDATVAYCRFGS